jgi:hypothetical protein
LSHLVQILLPLTRPDGTNFPAGLHEAVAKELADRFGGLTAYSRAPAKGLWKERPGKVERDDIVVYEVMTDDLDETWWTRYRATLERRFEQDELVVRVQVMRRL